MSFTAYEGKRVYDGDKQVPKKVDRFEVIDHRSVPSELRHYPENTKDTNDLRGRVYVARPCKVEFVYQDDGRTLKVFVTDAP